MKQPIKVWCCDIAVASLMTTSINCDQMAPLVPAQTLLPLHHLCVRRLNLIAASLICILKHQRGHRASEVIQRSSVHTFRCNNALHERLRTIKNSLLAFELYVIESACLESILGSGD